MSKMRTKKISVNNLIIKFLEPRIIGVIGASDSKSKFGCFAYRELKNRGYRLYPVNSSRKYIDGDECFQSTHLFPGNVKNILIILPPLNTENLVREIDPSVIEMVWMQNGAESDEAVRTCRDKGIEVIYGQCILMHAKPVRSYHLLHRWWWLISGQDKKV